jgi:hypothetical protein
LEKPPVTFGDVRRDRQGCTVELVGQEEVATRKALRERAAGVGKRDGFLINDQLLEGERHGGMIPAERRK